MQLNEVVSTNIKSIGYEDGNLMVVYQAGGKYLYEEVPVEVYQQLLEAESKGRFMNSIKRNYKYTKVVD